MYSVSTSAGYKMASNIDIAHDTVITSSGPQKVNSMHPHQCAIHRIAVGSSQIALPDFLLVKTLSGDIPVGRLIQGIKLICYGVEERVNSNVVVYNKAKASKLGINGYFNVSGLEVKNK